MSQKQVTIWGKWGGYRFADNDTLYNVKGTTEIKNEDGAYFPVDD